MWFNSSNLEANVSNTCVFSISDQEKLNSQNLDLQSNTWHNLTYAYQGEGGSKVTYLDGRKVAEDQAEDTFGDYPPFAMTGYSQGGYVVSSGGYENGTSFPPWKAFNNEDGSGGDSCWSVGASWNATDNFFNGTTNVANGMIINLDGVPNTTVGGVGGHWVNLELPHKLVVNYVEIHPRYAPSADWDERIPEQFYIAGTNDGYHWYTIHHKNTNGVPAIGSVDTQAMTGAYSNVGFKNIRMYVTKIGHGKNRLDIGIINYYGHRENDLVRLPDPTNVLKYPHVALTGPGQRGYVVTGSTYSHFPASGDPDATWRSFNGVTGNNADVWKTWEMYTTAGVYSPGSYSRTASSITDTSSTQHSGEYLVLETPHKIKLSSWDVRAEYAPRRIVDYAILGSDTNSSDANKTGWTLLTSGTFAAQQDVTATVSSPTTAFKYHAIVVKSVTSNGDSRRSQVHEMKLFGTEEATPVPIQIGGGNIDKVANFRVYDKFVGEDQALEIWDAQKDYFGRAKSQMVLQQGKIRDRHGCTPRILECRG